MMITTVKVMMLMSMTKLIKSTILILDDNVNDDAHDDDED